MICGIHTKLQAENSYNDNKEEKKRTIEEWASKIGIDWIDVENLLIWKKPRVSLLGFTIFSAFFWKFISYELQVFGFVILLAAVPCSIPLPCTYVGRTFCERFRTIFNFDRMSLGYNANDICELIANCWIKYEHHCMYLYYLRYTSVTKFCLITLSYVLLIVFTITSIPLAEMIYVVLLLFYFQPILSQFGVFNMILEAMEKLTRPVIYWTNSQTKQSDDHSRESEEDSGKNDSLSDIENEEFIPTLREECGAAISESMSDQHDEFQLHGDIAGKNENCISNKNEKSFLPANSCQVPEEFPSISTSDNEITSHAEDELEKCLDLKSMPVTDSDCDSTENSISENCAMEDINLSSFKDDDERLQEIEELLNSVLEDVDSKNVDADIDEEFEMLDQTELENVTNEEIMEQNFGDHSHTDGVVSNSNILCY